MRIYYSSKFRREYKKLPAHIKKLAEERERLFRYNPFDRVLETHKLHGHFKGYWAFSIDDTHRIIFEFVKKGVVWFHSVGDHSIYN